MKSTNIDESVLIGNRIRYYRNEKRMSQDKLADVSDISKSHIQRLERGGLQNPGIVTLRALADALEIPVSYLIIDDE